MRAEDDLHVVGPDRNPAGVIFDLDTFAVHDGPGIRMAVYLKGCPLSCKWCHSPESISRDPQIVFARDRCLLCGECVVACPQGGHRVHSSQHEFVRDQCAACGECTERCLPGALALKGWSVSAEEIVAKAVRLKPFFDHSGGGLTLTGGEPTMQPGFAAVVLEGCRREGIHTAVETCGLCDWERLEQLAAHSDLLLYDLKLMDESAHREWTGASNQRILDNARRLGSGPQRIASTIPHLGRCGIADRETATRRSSTFPVDVQVRIPLIPEITDTNENLGALFDFMREVGLPSAVLLPYNPSAGAKYEWLDLPYDIEGETQTQARLAELVRMGESKELRVTVG